MLSSNTERDEEVDLVVEELRYVADQLEDDSLELTDPPLITTIGFTPQKPLEIELEYIGESGFQRTLELY